MHKGHYIIPLKERQHLRLIPLGDVHFDTPACDRERLVRLVDWCVAREKDGDIVRLFGLGDYADFGSPSERRILASGNLHETTAVKFDRGHLEDLRELVRVLRPLKGKFIGLLTGHHEYLFASQKVMGPWKGRSSDAWLAHQLGCDYWGNGVSLCRLAFRHECRGAGCPHPLHLDILAYHGTGSAQTPGGRVQKRMRVAEIAPTAHIVVTGHDNSKLSYPRSGLDFDRGSIKRYAVGSGSFQRGYLEDEEAGYAERMGLVPADLGVVIIDIAIERRHGQWRVDYHVST